MKLLTYIYNQIKLKLEEVAGSSVAGVTGYVTGGIFDEFVKPILIAVLSGALTFIAIHFLKKLFKKMKV